MFLVPAAAAPEHRRCHGDGYCPPRSFGWPTRPFVYVGRLGRTARMHQHRRFAFRLPAHLESGDYRVFLYCRICGHSLIQSGSTMQGDLLRVRRLAQHEHAVSMHAGEQRVAFTLRRTAGVVLHFRLTLPRGSQADLTGRIGSVAGVRITTASGDCRHTAAGLVCTQQVEWCPLPRGTWTFRLHKRRGPPGDAVLAFRIGTP